MTSKVKKTHLKAAVSLSKMYDKDTTLGTSSIVKVKISQINTFPRGIRYLPIKTPMKDISWTGFYVEVIRVKGGLI